ncbi:leucine-rich repeat domain-containing protein [Desulfococcaceae bacterium HSG8]|nr:leucine-rich repeat domain-containing protein [Desulfococcaceae bacterium HSG8]
MFKKSTIIIILLFAASGISTNTYAAIPVAERNALIDLYNSTDGENWSDNSDWLGDTGTECTWYGITCDARDTHIVHANLSGNNLTGTIPPSLGNLLSLEQLDLYDNHLTGEIPQELGNLPELKALRLYINQLSGSVPPELGNLSNLEGLDLGENQLSGAIPPELGNLSNLKFMYLDINQLTGNIPWELGNLSNLEYLFLSANQLSGTIPPELGSLSALKWLYLQGNQLTGSIPPEIGNLSELEEGRTDLRWNALYTSSDDLRAFLGARQDDSDWESSQTIAPAGLTPGNPTENSVSLSWIPIPYTGDTGGYEVYYAMGASGEYSLYNTTSDKTADSITLTGLSAGTTYYFRIRTFTNPHESNGNIVYSEYTDSVPATTAGSSGIPPGERNALIDLYNSTDGDYWENNTNWLGDPGTECTWYGITCDAENTHVTEIDLGGDYPEGNNLVGTIPGSVEDIQYLRRFELSGNSLTGDIPPELGNLPELRELHLGVNDLGGDIPPELGNLSQLQSLDLGNNKVTGDIPSELGSLSDLQRLSLSENSLTGEIPPELGNLSELRELYLSGNGLTGSIPPELGNLSQLEVLYLSENSLTGEIPGEMGNLSALTSLLAGMNRLTGSIPPELGELSELYQLDLSGNDLTGSIPPELGSLSDLQQLYLEYNRLSGEIPQEMGNLSDLRSLFLKNNELTGDIPPELGNLSGLRQLYLDHNQLTGAIPSELGNLSELYQLDLSANNLSGNIPSELTRLSHLDPDQSDFRWNAFYTSDSDLRNFLNIMQISGDWESTQTVAPEGQAATGTTESSVSLTWNPILYTSDTGGYEVYYSVESGGNYTLYDTTADKTVGSITVTGLGPETTYFFRIRAITGEHENNDNAVTSEYTEEISAKTASVSAAQYTITATAGSGGTISPSGTVSVMHGDRKTFVFTPDSDYSVDNVSVDDTSAGSVTTYIFRDISSQHTIHVSFRSDILPVIPSAERDALIALYNAAAGEEWENNALWLGDPGTECTWYGITCDEGDTHVAEISLEGNNLVGQIPGAIENLTDLQHLDLSGNTISGSIPRELGSLSELRSLDLSGNQLAGAIPDNLANLSNLEENRNDFRWNALYTSDQDLQDFLAARQEGGDWESTQTIAPESPDVVSVTENSVSLTWEPITYTTDTGGYEVYYTAESEGDYKLFGGTPDKTGNSLTVTDLSPATAYIFQIRAFTGPHENNVNTVSSEYTKEVFAVTSDGSQVLHTIRARVKNGEGGSIEPSGAVSVADGEDRKFRIKVSEGWELDKIRVDGEKIDSDSELDENGRYVFKNVTEDHIIKVIFRKIHTITALAEPSEAGKIEPSGPVMVSHGADQTFSITRNPGYEDWDIEVTADGVSLGELTSYTFENAEGDADITVTFQKSRMYHSADYNRDFHINFDEILRIIQLYNGGAYHCAADTEDGYAPGKGDRACGSHDSDYDPQDWDVDFDELLQIIRFYNADGYHPDDSSEDGFAPGNGS